MSSSNLERTFETYLHQFGHDLPEPTREYHFARVALGDSPHPPARPHLRKRLDARGLHDWKFDFAWGCEMVAVEIDGGQWLHSGGRHNRDSDRDKLNAAAWLGWRVLRFTGGMLKRDPVGCIEQVRNAVTR